MKLEPKNDNFVWFVVIGFILIILLMYGACGCAPPADASGHPEKTPAQIKQSLIENYAHVNDGYFNGDLPREVEITYTPDASAPIGRTDYTPLRIYVNSYFDRSEREALMTEEHEMCHVWVYETGDEFEDHGPRWKSCMIRLANEGAFDGLW